MKKILKIILKKFTNISSIHFSTINNYYSDNSDDTINDNRQKIVSLYQINNDLLKRPPIKSFHFFTHPEKNRSYILFEHEEINQK